MRKAAGRRAAGTGSRTPPRSAEALRLYSRGERGEVRRRGRAGGGGRSAKAWVSGSPRSSKGSAISARVIISCGWVWRCSRAASTSASVGRATGAEALADDLAPEQAGFDEIPHRLDVDATNVEDVVDLLGRQAAAGGELVDALLDGVVGELDVHVLAGLLLHPILGQLLDGERAHVVAGAEGLEQLHPLLDVVVGDDAVVDGDRRREGIGRERRLPRHRQAERQAPTSCTPADRTPRNRRIPSPSSAARRADARRPVDLRRRCRRPTAERRSRSTSRAAR